MSEDQFTEHLSDERLYELMALLEWPRPIRTDLNSARDAIRELIFQRRGGAQPLTKREQFAAMAMQAILTGAVTRACPSNEWLEMDTAVRCADALLTALLVTKEAP
jgi:hypothetical protein